MRVSTFLDCFHILKYKNVKTNNRKEGYSMEISKNQGFRSLYEDIYENIIKEEKRKTENPDKTKNRLFVDMDGTLAEWRNIQITINSSEETYEDILQHKLQKLDEVLYLPGYFRTLRPNVAVVNAIKEIIKDNNIEVFSLSCVKDDRDEVSPLKEKNGWLDDYLPEIDKDHRIFVPDGEDKTEYIPGGISKNDYILDDYTKNLVDWEKVSGPGNAIKLLNNVNESNGSWQGNSVSYANESKVIASTIENIVNGLEKVSHESPRKDKKPITNVEFMSMYKSVSILNKVAIFKDYENIPKMIYDKILSENWNYKAIQINKNTDNLPKKEIINVYYGSEKDLVCELIDMKAGRTQGIIPKEIVQELEEFVKGFQINAQNKSLENCREKTELELDG